MNLKDLKVKNILHVLKIRYYQKKVLMLEGPPGTYKSSLIMALL